MFAEVDGDVVATTTCCIVMEKSWGYDSDPVAGTTLEDALNMRLQPFHEWGNRGAGTMRVFLPTA